MAPGWLEGQARRAEAGTLATARAQVVQVEMRGDVAWVEVESARPPIRRVRFYRRTARGWAHTGPRPVFWRAPVEWTYGDVSVRCYEPDQEQVEPLARAVAQAYDEACRELACPPPRGVEVRFVHESALVDAPRAAPGVVWLASPWLSGVGPDGGPDPVGLARASYWGRWAAAAGCVGVPQLNSLQGALAAEYATWAGGEPAWASPLLGRAIERHGTEVLPQVFRSLQEGPTLDAFLAEWLDLSADENAIAYLTALVQIETEALHAGQRETFLLLQDGAAWWQEQQKAAFERWQWQAGARWRPETTVERVVFSEDSARVTWHAHLLSSRREPRRQVSYYRRQDGGWVRTWRPFCLGPAIGSDHWSRGREVDLSK
jgi:hypothetical protein